MSVGDEYRGQMWREVLALCELRRDEGVIVLTGESSHLQNVDAAMRAAVSLGARPFRVELPPVPPWQHGADDRTAAVGTTPLSGNPWALGALKQAGLIIDLLGLLHSPEQVELLAGGTRMLMVVEPPEVLARMVPTRDDKRRVMAANAALAAARSMHVRSGAGTDLRLGIGQFPTLPEYGYADVAGHWDHWPSGFLSTWPNEGSAEGQVVIDVGDMLFPFKRYVESAPIRLRIEAGFIVDIAGGFEADYLKRHLASYRDPGAYAVSHVGWGLQPRARWTGLGMRDKAQSLGMDARAYYGNFLFSTGPNAEAGGGNRSACHVDIPMARCSLWLDGQPMLIDGDVVAPDQAVEGAGSQ
ncbi:2,5-dihydroxypyridine 5,6-dioxygenase [Pigmentiphaga kullae]|uniref:2,5-dihydroxypyridine 5,6-dioxygenase n=1 Tax=Pigmentiphaga kullae TaxID=151784 RepID=A0A4Q7N7U2_9BURK|nr:2,5-dihydroxypyridine 5,6-dioxygenase [Pigmentiphaga kullae]RZS78069.1 2,5-dihydroxypyridine 5,6-dioxygenase [Pigmentiphaga kullae]